MAFDAHLNFATSLVATAPSPASSGTSLVVTAADGAKFPAVPFNAVVCPASTNPTTTNAEVVRVTAISTDTLTITRAQESSSARTVVVGDQIFAAITAKTLTDVEAQAAVYKTLFLNGTRNAGTVGAASTKYFIQASGFNVSSADFVSEYGVVTFKLTAADLAVTGLTTKLRLVVVEANAAAPAITVTAGLYPVTAGATQTLGTVVTGSTVAFTTPSANTTNSANSGDFTLPSDGVFALGYIVSGSPSNAFRLDAMLQFHHV